MFPNCVAKVFRKCQRAVRAQNPCSTSLVQVSQKLPQVVAELKLHLVLPSSDPGFLKANMREMERFSALARHKFGELAALVKQQWHPSKLLAELKQQFVLREIPARMKPRSTNPVRLWAQQCECVIAQRIRRGQQIFSLYSQLWEERALREVVARLSGRGRLLLASCVAAAFDWDKERISDDAMVRHMGDIELVYKLQECTLSCTQCGLRLQVDSAQATIKYCQCPKNTSSRGQSAHLAEWQETIDPSAEMGQEWRPFIDRQDVLVWRQENQQASGLFAYKVYGRYDDVTAHDFLQVQLDTEYRREWDSSAVQLRVLDKEPGSASEVLYWEMAWPRLFANRDYVFKRRAVVNAERGRIVIGCESTQHPDCPPRPGLHRVTEYWSFMVIKPTTHFDQPGIEFSLTYFDNPGLSIPSPVAAWVAISGLPDFLQRLREAAREVAARRGGAPSCPCITTSSQPPPSTPSMSSTPGTEACEIPSCAVGLQANSSQQQIPAQGGQ